MGTMLQCPRKHYWRYEVGLIHDSDTLALRLGSAWAKAQEARWRGADYQTALATAVPEQTKFEPIDLATFSALLAGYYRHYEHEAGTDTLVKELNPEVEFCLPLAKSRTFRVAGKMDGLAVLHDGRLALKEDKTTKDSVAPDSDYWLRLRFNPQLLQYILAARTLGWDVATVVYDVVRKPAIRPKQIPKQDRVETPQEFAQRLFEDTIARPDFYFARREVPILEDNLDEFREHREVIAQTILHNRRSETRFAKPERAWMRNVSERTCNFCPYQFCLHNIGVDLATPPAGFRVGDPHPELSSAAGDASPDGGISLTAPTMAVLPCREAASS